MRKRRYLVTSALIKAGADPEMNAKRPETGQMPVHCAALCGDKVASKRSDDDVFPRH